MILDSQIYSLRWENHPSVNEKAFSITVFLFCSINSMVRRSIQSTIALRTPRYNGHPDNTDSR